LCHKKNNEKTKKYIKKALALQGLRDNFQYLGCQIWERKRKFPEKEIFRFLFFLCYNEYMFQYGVLKGDLLL